MRIIKLRTNGVLEIKSIKNELKALQNEVGGNIEPVRFAEDVIMLVDEEGVLKRRSRNPFFSSLRGDIILCGVKGESFAGLSLFKARKLVRLFGEINTKKR